MSEFETLRSGLREAYSRISDLEAQILITQNLGILRKKLVTRFVGPVFWEPRGFFGNAMHLFLAWDELAAARGRERPIWLTRDSEVEKYLKAQGYRVRVWRDSQSKYDTFVDVLSSPALICTNGDYLPPMGNSLIFDIFKDKPIIQLWHGIPTKNLERHWPEMDLTTLSSAVNIVSRTNLLVMPSRLKDMEESLGSPRVILGSYPRTWPLLEAAGLLSKKMSYRNAPRHPNGHVKTNALYAPTFSNENDEAIQSALARQLNQACVERDLELRVKPHPNHSDEFSQNLRAAGITVIDQMRDVQDALIDASVLVTDVSSICADFLILNRPMIFTHWAEMDVVKLNRAKFLERDIPGLISHSSEDLNQTFLSAIHEDSLSPERHAKRIALHGRAATEPLRLIRKIEIRIALFLWFRKFLSRLSQK